MAKITLELPAETIAYLQLLDPSGAENALAHLAHSAADGLCRPGAWERDWISQAFPQDDFLERAETKVGSGEMEYNEFGQLVFVKPAVP